MINVSIGNYKNNSNLNECLDDIDKDTIYFIYKDEESIASIVGIKYLDWDSKIFSKKIGLFSINYGNLNDEILDEVNKFCIKEKYECLFTKASTAEYRNMHILENHGFNIMDTIVTLKTTIQNKNSFVEDSYFKYRFLEESDLFSVIDIIDNLYSFGRFFEDSNLDNKDVNKLYKQWITNEIKNKNIDVIGIEYKNKLVGFISCKYIKSKINDKKEGSISLVGIDKNYQGIGIGKKLMNYVLNNFYDKGIQTVYVGTQIDNINALNFYISSGFKIENSSNSFHKIYS